MEILNAPFQTLDSPPSFSALMSKGSATYSTVAFTSWHKGEVGNTSSGRGGGRKFGGIGRAGRALTTNEREVLGSDHNVCVCVCVCVGFRV
jgi:hypothetical protein